MTRRMVTFWACRQSEGERETEMWWGGALSCGSERFGGGRRVDHDWVRGKLRFPSHKHNLACIHRSTKTVMIQVHTHTYTFTFVHVSNPGQCTWMYTWVWTVSDSLTSSFYRSSTLENQHKISLLGLGPHTGQYQRYYGSRTQTNMGYPLTGMAALPLRARERFSKVFSFFF